MEFIYTAESMCSVRALLIENNYSPSLLSKIKQAKSVFYLNKFIYLDYVLQPGEFIRVVLPDEICHSAISNKEIKIIYEDEYLMVVDKPANLATISTFSHYEDNLGARIHSYYKKNKISSTIHFVNRLDKETSGLILVAKHAYVHHLFSLSLQSINRFYQVLVSGIFFSKEGFICLPIRKVQSENTTKRFIDQEGKESITSYRVIKYFQNSTLLEAQLMSGRTHQIRVHFAYLGFPLIGDPLYGEGKGELQLRSYKLIFLHPITKQKLEFICE